MPFDIPEMIRTLRANGLFVVVIDERTEFPAYPASEAGEEAYSARPGFFGTEVQA